ncbi:MAG: alpha/beta hydrolase [Treponema sp.]|nr:alpha/beta hydrolase [Treponema sp.]
MKIEKIKLYEDREDVLLTAYILDDSPEMLKGGLRPAVVICPGGGYFSCSDREAEPVAMAFASMGYHAFVLKYSTYGMDAFINHFADMKSRPHCQNPNPMKEVGMAFKIVKENAEGWKVDKNRVAVCGFSAGAHNAAMYSTNWFKEVITNGEDEELYKPAACILGYCLSDYIYMKDHNTDKAFFDASNLSFFGSKDVSDEQLKEASPALNVTEKNPPTFLWATSEDSLVPVQHTLRMAHALADCKVPFEVHIFENGPHALSVASQASACAKNQIYPDVAKWVSLAEAWLLKRFALNLPDSFSYAELGI